MTAEVRRHEGEARSSSEFTAELRGSRDTYFSRVYAGDPPGRELRRTDHFAVLVDVAPLVEGHLLVVPLEDRPSFAALPDAAWAEWRELKSRLADSLARCWAPPVFFEHGSTNAMVGACITHAHLHALPAAIDLVRELEADGLELQRVSDQRAARELRGAELPYFYVENRDGERALARADVGFPSQYLRRVSARVLGLEDPAWDWNVVVRKDLLRSTFARLKGGL